MSIQSVYICELVLSSGKPFAWKDERRFEKRERERMEVSYADWISEFIVIEKKNQSAKYFTGFFQVNTDVGIFIEDFRIGF